MGSKSKVAVEPVINVINISRPPPNQGTRNDVKKRLHHPVLTTPSIAHIFCKLPNKKRKMSSLVDEGWMDEGDQDVMDGYDEFLKRPRVDMATKQEESLKDVEEPIVLGAGSQGLEDDIWGEEDYIQGTEDDVFKESDGSWEQLADDTLSMMEQRCSQSVVTNLNAPDQPKEEVVVEQVVVHSVPLFEGDNSHIKWATTILDAAFSSDSCVTDNCFEAGNTKCLMTDDNGDDDNDRGLGIAWRLEMMRGL